MNNAPKPFTGTIDQLLSHCSDLEVDHITKESQEEERLSFEEAVALYMEEMGVSQDVAEFEVEKIMFEEFSNNLDKMVEDGLLRISGYNDMGEPMYEPTELGNKITEKLMNETKDDPDKNSGN